MHAMSMSTCVVFNNDDHPLLNHVAETVNVPSDKNDACKNQNKTSNKSDTENVRDSQKVSQSEAVDLIQGQLGGYGRYQILIYFLIGFVYMRGCWHAFISTYQVYDPGHHCQATSGYSLNESVPGSYVDGVWTWSECSQFINFTASNRTERCRNGWTFLWREPEYTSATQEFDFVCDDKNLNELSTTIYMVGTTCGVLFLSPLSDRFGSKKMMIVCLWLQMFVGVSLIWSHYVPVFFILKFFIGVFNMTIALCAYVLMTETFDAAHRELPTIGMQFFWAGGIMTLALFGYLLPKWEHLQLVVSIPFNAISVIYIWLIPESLPWLLSKGRLKAAKSVILRFVHINKLQSISDLDDRLLPFQSANDSSTAVSETSNSKQGRLHSRSELVDGLPVEGKNNKLEYTVFSLFKTPHLCKNTLIMFYLFLVNALAYFGITFSAPTIDGDRFLNLFFLGLVEIPAYLFCIVFHKFIGRRRTICIFLFVCAACNLAVPFIPDSGSHIGRLKVALVMIGKFGVTGSYSSIYLYASEIFPTVVRSQGIGASSFFENIGSIAAPSMVQVNEKMKNLPLAIFGAMAVVGSVLVLFLPETHNRPLPQTINDVENWKDLRKKKTRAS